STISERPESITIVNGIGVRTDVVSDDEGLVDETVLTSSTVDVVNGGIVDKWIPAFFDVDSSDIGEQCR
ncbi:hypothetical protein NDU88_010752, partial [Pleurodeles waltl]